MRRGSLAALGLDLPRQLLFAFLFVRLCAFGWGCPCCLPSLTVISNYLRSHTSAKAAKMGREDKRRQGKGGLVPAAVCDAADQRIVHVLDCTGTRPDTGIALALKLSAGAGAERRAPGTSLLVLAPQLVAAVVFAVSLLSVATPSAG